MDIWHNESNILYKLFNPKCNQFNLYKFIKWIYKIVLVSPKLSKFVDPLYDRCHDCSCWYINQALHVHARLLFVQIEPKLVLKLLKTVSLKLWFKNAPHRKPPWPPIIWGIPCLETQKYPMMFLGLSNGFQNSTETHKGEALQVKGLVLGLHKWRQESQASYQSSERKFWISIKFFRVA